MATKISAGGRGSIAQVQYTGDEAAAEFRTLLDAVVANEDELDPWQTLVNRVSEFEGKVTRNSSPSIIELLRHVYDCFLAKFPLFFGYWKRYADLEFNIGGSEAADMVYERGISCIPTSVDLWSSYCMFKMDTCHDPDIVRALFERGVEAVGLDYRNEVFWDQYLEFEGRVNDQANITQIFRRIISIPTYQFDRYYHKFRNLIDKRPRSELLESEQLEELENQVRANNPNLSPPEYERLIVAGIDAHYLAIYHRIQKEVTKLWAFEGKIRRNYFDVPDVDKVELENWRAYLDYEEKQGDAKRIAYLYERCLVPCATHEEFWLRYARWMFAQGRDEDARNIYRRASCIFVPIGQPTVRLHWARFEEKLGSIQTARDIHVAILEQLPEHVETLISLAGVVRRHEGVEAALQVLQEYIDQHSEDFASQLLSEQARILWQCTGDAEKARQIFLGNHQKYLGSATFWINYLNFEINQSPVNVGEDHYRVQQVYQMARDKASLSSEAMKDLSNYYMEFLLNRGGSDIAKEYMLLDGEVNGYRRSSANNDEMINTPNEVMKEAQRQLNGHAGVAELPSLPPTLDGY